MSGCRIANVRVQVLRCEPDKGRAGILDGGFETAVFEVVDADGRVGIGEADGPPAIMRELVELKGLQKWFLGLKELVVGADPFEITALHRKLLTGTYDYGRTGLVMHAVSALDIALHDLVGKQMDRPCYQLLGGRQQAHVRPYATCYVGPEDGLPIRTTIDLVFGKIEQAQNLGFSGVKLELPFGNLISDAEVADLILEARSMIGTGTTLFVDFGYRWRAWEDAAHVLRRVSEANVYLAEAVLTHEGLEPYRELRAHCDVRLGGAELATSVWECREWIQRARVQVLQVDPIRCGGLSAMRTILALAELEGVEVIPHHWKTGISLAALMHLQTASELIPWIEMAHPLLVTSPLQQTLAGLAVDLVDGVCEVPAGAGLGITLDRQTFERWSVGR